MNELFQIPATHPPALEAARRRLQTLCEEYAELAADLPRYAKGAVQKLEEVRAQEREVTRLETEGRG